MSSAVHITLEDFLRRAEREDDWREELLEGEVIVSPGAKMSHALIVSRLRRSLSPPEQLDFVIANDFACVLGLSMPIPHLAAIAEDRMQNAVDKDGWLTGSPELVVEVASPSNRKLPRKAEMYLEHGAEQVWLVYPVTRMVTVAVAS